MSPRISPLVPLPDLPGEVLPHPHDPDHEPAAEVRTDAAAVAQTQTPPLLTGGVKHTYTEQAAYFTLISGHVDAITATVPVSVGSDLVAQLERVEIGYAGQGFAESERYMLPGGFAWRKYHPHQPSKEWGTQYESWEVTGGGSEWLAHRLASAGVRPSRVDYAFDYQCPDWLYPAHVVDVPPIRDHTTRMGFGISHSGPEITGSKYIGTRNSGRMVNIYRRDLKHQHLLADFGPIMRTELRLFKKHAAEFYSNTLAAFRDPGPLASSHLAEIMYYAAVQEGQPIPIISDAGADRELGEQLALFVDQNASLLEIAHQKGVDLEFLANLRLRLASRSAKYQHQKRCIRWAEADGQESVEFAARILVATRGTPGADE